MKTRRDMVLGAAGASLAASVAQARAAKPQAGTGGVGSTRARTSGGIVDVHAHVIDPGYQALLVRLGGKPASYAQAPAAKLDGAPPPPTTPGPLSVSAVTAEAVGERVKLMDQAGVARQVLSTPYAPYFEDEASAVKAARHINDLHAGVVAKQPDRLAAFVALPLPHIDASLRELKRGMDELGMVGVGIQCFCLDRSVADDHYFPIYEELNRREAVLFFHPCSNGICSPLVTEWGLTSTAGPLFEDTTVALHLIIKQIPRRFPKIRIIIPHLGGALPNLLNRLDNQLGLSIPGLPEKPSVTARRFWYDTVGHGSKAAFCCGLEAFGETQLLPGSDYPILLPFEAYHQTFDYIRRLGLPASTVDRVLYQNARDVFGEGVDKPAPLRAPRSA